jgi:hypothetical protein
VTYRDARGDEHPIRVVVYDPRGTSRPDLETLSRRYYDCSVLPAIGALTSAERYVLHRQAGRPVLFFRVRRDIRQHFCRRWKCYDVLRLEQRDTPTAQFAEGQVECRAPRRPTPAGSHVDLLARLSAFVDDPIRALDLVYDSIDNWARRGEIREIDRALRATNTDEVPLEILLGFLTITIPWRGTLPERPIFYSKVALRAAAELPATEVQPALRGLE